MKENEKPNPKCPTCSDEGYVNQKIASYDFIFRCYCDRGFEVPITRKDKKTGQEFFIPLLPGPTQSNGGEGK